MMKLPNVFSSKTADSAAVDKLVDGATTLVEKQRSIQDQITKAGLELGLARADEADARTELSSTLAAGSLGNVGDEQVEQAERNFDDAARITERKQLLLDGLRAQLVDTGTERQLKQYESDLHAAIKPLASAATSGWQGRYARAYQEFVGLIREGSALSRITGQQMIDTTPARPRHSGEPIPDPQYRTVELLVPKFNDVQSAAAAIGSPDLQRIVVAQNDVTWSLGMITGERNRQNRERSQADRAARGFRPRYLDRSWTTDPAVYNTVPRPAVPTPITDEIAAKLGATVEKRLPGLLPVPAPGQEEG